MEDLWRVKRCGVDMKDLADYAEYRHFLKRFSDDEEKNNRRNLLYGEATNTPPAEVVKKL